MENMQKQYGSEKGKSVFYASKNKGTISGVDADPNQDRLDRLTTLYHELREKWKDAHGAERNKLADQVSYVQQQMYQLSAKVKGGQDADTPAMLEYKLGEAKKRLKQARGPQEAQAARATIERITKELSGLKGGQDADNDEDQLDMLSEQYREAVENGDTATARLTKVAMRLITDRLRKSKGGQDAEEGGVDSGEGSRKELIAQVNAARRKKGLSPLSPAEIRSMSDEHLMVDLRGLSRDTAKDAELGHLSVGTKGAHDAMPMRFACDGVPACQGQIVARIGNCVLLQGMALDSGAWFVRGPDGPRRFTVKQDALDYIEYAMDAAEDPAEERAMRDRMNGIERNAEGKIIAIRGRKLVPPKEATFRDKGTRDAELYPGSSKPNKEGQELYSKMAARARPQEKAEHQKDLRRYGSFSRQDIEGMDIEKATVSYAKPKEAEPPTAAEMAASRRGMDADGGPGSGPVSGRAAIATNQRSKRGEWQNKQRSELAQLLKEPDPHGANKGRIEELRYRLSGK